MTTSPDTEQTVEIIERYEGSQVMYSVDHGKTYHATIKEACRALDTTISPTENTEELDLDLYDVALDFLVEAIDKGEIEAGELRDGGRRDKSIANTATIRLANLIASQRQAILKEVREGVPKEAPIKSRQTGAIKAMASLGFNECRKEMLAHLDAMEKKV